MASPRKKIVDAFLKKFLDEVPVAEQERLAAEAGIHPPRTPKKGEQLDIFRPATPQIKRWVDEGAPGLSKYAKIKERIAEKEGRSPLAKLWAGDEEAMKKAREREKLLELDYDSPLDEREISILFDIDERTTFLDNLKTTGQAKKNLDDFTEALTNRKIIETAIKEGKYANPKAWDQAAGLPPWPKDLRNPRQIALMRLGYADPFAPSARKFETATKERRIKEELKLMATENGRTPQEVMDEIDVEKIRAQVEAEKVLEGSPKFRATPTGQKPTRKWGKTLTTKAKNKLAELDRIQAERGFLFPREERLKAEANKLMLSPEEEIAGEWRRLGGGASEELPTGRHPRTGAQLPQERPWSKYHQDKYNILVQEKRINDPNYMPSPVEERALQRQVTKEIDAESRGYLSDEDIEYYKKQGLTSEQIQDLVRQASTIDKYDVVPIPGTKGERKFVRSDVGSPASSMHELMRGGGYTDEAAERGLLEGQEVEFASADDIPLVEGAETIQDIDMEAVMQRYQNPQAMVEKLSQDPVIAVAPNVNIDRAIQQRIDRRAVSPAQVGRERTLERISARPEFKRYMQDTAETFEPDRQLDLPIRIEPTAEVAADLRSRAAELTRRGQQFKQEVSELPIEQRKQAEIEIINRPEYREFQAARRALKREIGIQAPDLMEYAPYTRPQKTINRRRLPAKPRLLEPIQLDMIDELLKQETILDRAFAEGKININNPKIMARWKADAPRREAKRKLLEKSKKEIAAFDKMKGLIASEKRIVKSFNKMQDELDAIGTGFIKKDKTANLSAWKKAGRPKPLDWEDTHTDKRVTSKRKLVDTFKKGRKIVNRKRGGLLKKPRGWGAARYKGT